MENENAKEGKNQTSTVRTSDERKPIKLLSPGDGESLYFTFNESENNYLIALEILDIIRSVMIDYPEVEAMVQNYCKLEEVDVYNYSAVRSLSKKFNKAINHLIKNKLKHENAPVAKSLMNKDLLRQIVTKCYNKAVDNEKALNKHYEAFSSQTYGETSYDRMQMILDEIQPTKDDIFVDLGSGVGQLIVHVAGATNVKAAVGIEIAKLPAKFATTLELEFKKWMNWYGKSFSSFKLEHGDFLDENYRQLITNEATIIFINNFAFQADLESRIKMELLKELKDGTKIISTKPYVPLNKGAITDRQLNDISVIIDITELKQCPNPCSWTSAYVPYYMHVINRAKLERYFLNRNPALRGRSNDGTRRSLTPSSKTSNSRESSVGLKDRETSYKCSGYNKNTQDEYGCGPTTRRKWQDYVSELEQQKKKKTIVEKNENLTIYTEKDEEKKIFEKRPEEKKEKNEIYDCQIAAGTSGVVFDDSQTTENFDYFQPLKKVRRLDKKRDRAIIRGRPRKLSNYLGCKNSTFSDDAKEGIELMHEMTKAVSRGDCAEAAAILTDFNSKHKITNNKSLNSNYLNDKTNGLQTFPFPNISSECVINKTIDKEKLDKNQKNIGKYPNLEKFLEDLRNLYESFLDSIHIPEFVKNLSQNVQPEKKELFVNVDAAVDENNFEDSKEINVTNKELLKKVQDYKLFSRKECQQSHFIEKARNIIEANKRIKAKCLELESEINTCNYEMKCFVEEFETFNFEKNAQENKPNNSNQPEQFQNLINNKKQDDIKEFQEKLVVEQQKLQQKNLQDLLAILAQQQLSAQSQEITRLHSSNNQQSLLLPDLTQHYSQQIINTNSLLLELGKLLNQKSTNETNFDLSTLPSLTNVNKNDLSQSGLIVSPHQSPIMAAAIASLLSPLAQQSSNVITQPKQHSQQLTDLLSLTDLNSIKNANKNIDSSFFAVPSNNVELRSPTQSSALNVSENINNNNFHITPYSQPQNLSNNNLSCFINKDLSPTINSNKKIYPTSSTSNVFLNSEIISLSSSLNNLNAQTESFDEHSKVAAVVAAVAAGSSKKARSKPSKTLSGLKRNMQNVKELEDPARQEEIERQVKVIVAKALEVDSAAKCAEKERKAKFSEKKGKERYLSNVSMSLSATNFAGVSATVPVNYISLNNSYNNNKKKNNNELILSPTSLNSGKNTTSLFNTQTTNFFSSASSSSSTNSHMTTGLSATVSNLSNLNVKKISITSAAPPPHSPVSSDSETLQKNYSIFVQNSTYLTPTTNIVSTVNEIQTDFVNSSNVLNETTDLSKCVETNSEKNSKSQVYVPLSNRIMCENLQSNYSSLSPLSTVKPNKTPTVKTMLKSVTPIKVKNSFIDLRNQQDQRH